MDAVQERLADHVRHGVRCHPDRLCRVVQREVRREQNNSKRWAGTDWAELSDFLCSAGIEVTEQPSVGRTFAADAAPHAGGPKHRAGVM